MRAEVAILATGDEIVTGHIANSNGQQISSLLWQAGITPGMQILVSDNEMIMQSAMRYLLSHYQVLITIGGLGPTSDDRTRNALAAVLEEPLIFHSPSWDFLVKRLTDLQIKVSETNRQQCYFPHGAEILFNENGTAPGCHYQKNQQHVFMLPGPPNECLPIFNRAILPLLIKTALKKNIYKQSWFLLGPAEASLAEEILNLQLSEAVNVGYRVDTPYIELKISSIDEKVFYETKQKILPVIAEQIVSENNRKASEIFNDFLKMNPIEFIVDDTLYAVLSSVLPYNRSTGNKKRLSVEKIAGDSTRASRWQFLLRDQNKELAITFDVPYRKHRTVIWVAEYLCWALVKHFTLL